MYPKRCIVQPAKASYRRSLNCPIPEIPAATFRQVKTRVMVARCATTPSSLLHTGIHARSKTYCFTPSPDLYNENKVRFVSDEEKGALQNWGTN